MRSEVMQVIGARDQVPRQLALNSEIELLNHRVLQVVVNDVDARSARAGVLVGIAAGLAFVVPSALGENVSRLRFAAIPLVVLALSLREWRPRPLAVAALVLVVAWNAAPLARSFVRGTADPAVAASYWQPAIDYLQQHLTPAYRVEAVDTAGHWAAVYLPRAGIPLARGWYRQDDFPQNQVLYQPKLGAQSYLAWLRGLGIRYVVLTEAPHDYSARAEATLVHARLSDDAPRELRELLGEKDDE